MTPTRPQTAGQVDIARLTAAFPDANGKPRFTMALPRAALQDPGIAALVRGETERGGYEYPARQFLDDHLEPDDLFVDIGAHWGIFALHAATRHGVRAR